MMVHFLITLLVDTDGVMTPQTLTEFAQQYGRIHPVESILHYPHPFTNGGIIIVFPDDLPNYLENVADAYAAAPSSYTLHCVRQKELFLLSLPGLFAPPLEINEQPHLPYWLQHKGVVLMGTDLRAKIVPQTDPRMLLAGHIEGCMDYLRRYGVLMSLIQEKDDALAIMLGQEMKYLMGTALLTKGVWDIALETVADQFSDAFTGTRPFLVWQQVQSTAGKDILETVWLFEQFLRALREFAE